MADENYFDRVFPESAPGVAAGYQDASLWDEAPSGIAPSNDRADNTTRRLALALEMAAHGFRVFPLLPGSKEPPKGVAGVTRATTDAATIRAWFAADPAMNYGVAAGAGLLVVDVDAAKGGHEALKTLGLPETFAVKTPGGGLHLYYAASDVRNSVDVIAPGVDIRSAGGYVVGPGSYFADPSGRKGYVGPYEIAADLPAAAAPESLILRCGQPRERSDAPAACEPDLSENVAFAARYLQIDAPAAIQGSGGNNTAYAVAARLHELGVSPESAAALMAAHWNERCLPPWSDDELATICRNAANYAQAAFGAGAATVVAEGFAAVTIEAGQAATAPPAKLFRATVFDPTAPAEPPEHYLYGLHYVRGILSATAAPGGFGKSQLALAEAVCMATGRELLGERIYEPLRVWLVSLDDPARITRKRAIALMKLHGLAPTDFGDGRLMLDGNDTLSPAAVKLVSATRDGVTVNLATVNAFVAELRARQVDVLILDPLVKFHAVEENDNPAMNVVGETLAQIAAAAGCAVETVVHTSKPKGQQITAEHVRGASAFVNAARAVRVVNQMTEDEARRLGIEDSKRPWLFRVDLSKGNLAPPSDAHWFKRVSVALDNGDARMPEGEQFPAVAPYSLPNPVATTTEADTAKALAYLARGPDGAGSPWRASDKASGYAGMGIAEALGLDLGEPQTRVTCRKLIKDWLARGLLIQRFARIKAEGREAPFIHVSADWRAKIAARQAANAAPADFGGAIVVEDPNAR